MNEQKSCALIENELTGGKKNFTDGYSKFLSDGVMTNDSQIVKLNIDKNAIDQKLL